MTTSALAPAALGRFVPQLARVTGAGLARPALAGIVERAIASSTGGSRRRVSADPTRFDLVVKLSGPAGGRAASLAGPGIFDISGPIAARIAARTLDRDFELSGALSATEALADPQGFLDGLHDRGVAYSIGPIRAT